MKIIPVLLMLAIASCKESNKPELKKKPATNDGNASPVVVNTIFINNSAIDGGGSPGRGNIIIA